MPTLPRRSGDSRILERLCLGMWQTNCYLVGDQDRGSVVVIDPGQGAETVVVERLAVLEVRCEGLLLTHGHLDHLWAVPSLAERLDVPVFLHAGDRWLWDDPAAGFGNLPPGALRNQFGLDWQPPTERLQALADGATLRLAGLHVGIRHTPGHTPGSSAFLLRSQPEDDPLLISGDLLFAGSVGRTDFPRGSWAEQMASLRRVVLPMDDATPVLPGHGPETTVGRERGTNPYLLDLA